MKLQKEGAVAQYLWCSYMTLSNKFYGFNIPISLPRQKQLERGFKTPMSSQNIDCYMHTANPIGGD